MWQSLCRPEIRMRKKTGDYTENQIKSLMFPVRPHAVFVFFCTAKIKLSTFFVPALYFIILLLYLVSINSDNCTVDM